MSCLYNRMLFGTKKELVVDRKPKNEITKNKRNRSKSGGLEVCVCNTNVWEVGVVRAGGVQGHLW